MIVTPLKEDEAAHIVNIEKDCLLAFFLAPNRGTGKLRDFAARICDLQKHISSLHTEKGRKASVIHTSPQHYIVSVWPRNIHVSCGGPTETRLSNTLPWLQEDGTRFSCLPPCQFSLLEPDF